MEPPEHLGEKFRLHQRFPAGEGHTASPLEVGTEPQQPRCQFLCRDHRAAALLGVWVVAIPQPQGRALQKDHRPHPPVRPPVPWIPQNGCVRSRNSPFRPGIKKHRPGTCVCPDGRPITKSYSTWFSHFRQSYDPFSTYNIPRGNVNGKQKDHTNFSVLPKETAVMRGLFLCMQHLDRGLSKQDVPLGC